MQAISKEIFIMALLLMIVVFMLGMVFYKYMPNNKTIKVSGVFDKGKKNGIFKIKISFY